MAVFPRLAVIVPTRGEAGNISELVRRLDRAVGDSLEIIFVDDSDDETPEAIAAAAEDTETPITLIHREPHERANGLGGAVVAGIEAATAPWVCVMDGDLQHPPEVIPDLLREATRSNADLVLASRFRNDAQRAGLGVRREAVSRLFILMARLLFPNRLRHVSDPLTGFFVLRKEAVNAVELRPKGFKILLEIIGRTPSLEVSEVPFQFGERYAGKSKASPREALRYLTQLASLRLGGLSNRFARFGLVGLSGLAMNQLLLVLLTEVAGIHYLASAVLATQGSTLWNFALAERFVFTDRRFIHRRGLRLSMFLLVNNAALVVRGPMLVVLTAGVGIHYLASNIVSLLALTLLRYGIADTLIWSSKKHKENSYSYSIHDIITVKSSTRLPELERFLVEGSIEHPTIDVATGLFSSNGNHQSPNGHLAASEGASILRYSDGLGDMGFSIEIQTGEEITVRGSSLLARSPHVLYTNVVEPLLRWTFAGRGYALVHGACVAFGQQAFLITAKTDTGKTTTILRTLDNYPGSFISDDLTLLRADGQVLMYPKPLTISRHTVAAVKSALLSPWERVKLIPQSRIHSRSGRIFAKIIARTKLPAATINTVVQWAVPPPKYQIDRLVPNVHIASEGQLSGLVVIEKGLDNKRWLSADEAEEILMSNCEDAYGFPPYHEIEGFLRNADTRDLRPVERAIVSQALSVCPSMLISSSTMGWWKHIPQVLEEITDGEVVLRPQERALNESTPEHAELVVDG